MRSAYGRRAATGAVIQPSINTTEPARVAYSKPALFVDQGCRRTG